MKKFLTKLFLFFIPVVLGFFVIELSVRSMPSEYLTKIRNFETKVGDIEVLIFGSSHGLSSFNPNLFNQMAFNMAMSSQTLQIEHRILMKYKEKLSQLKMLIIPISYFSLTQKLTEGEIANRLPFYKFYYRLETPELSKFDFNNYSIASTLQIRRALRSIYSFYINGEHKITCDEKGWIETATEDLVTEKDLIIDAEKAVKRHEDGSQDFADNIKLLYEILDWNEKKSVRVIFVNTPKTSFYNERINIEKSQKIDAAINEIVSQYKNASYLNWKDDPNFEPADFHNSDHLNTKGAEKATKLIIKQCSKSLSN